MAKIVSNESEKKEYPDLEVSLTIKCVIPYRLFDEADGDRDVPLLSEYAESSSVDREKLALRVLTDDDPSEGLTSFYDWGLHETGPQNPDTSWELEINEVVDDQ